MASEWDCGEEVFQFHHERSLDCKGNTAHCAGGRATSSLADHRVGLFQVGKEESPLIGYSRGAWCASSDCADETVDRFANGLHIFESAFYAVAIGMGIFLLVCPDMISGFVNMFMA